MKEKRLIMSEETRWSLGRAVLAANRPDLCTFCIRPKTDPRNGCSGQHTRPTKETERNG